MSGTMNFVDLKPALASSVCLKKTIPFMVRFAWRFVLYFACLPCQAWWWTSKSAEHLNPKWRDDTKSSCHFSFRMFLLLYVFPHQRPCDRPFFNGAVTWSVLQRCAGHLHHPRRGRSSSCTKVIVTSLWQCWIHAGMILNDSKSFSGPLPIYDFNSALHVNLPCHLWGSITRSWERWRLALDRTTQRLHVGFNRYDTASICCPPLWS